MRTLDIAFKDLLQILRDRQSLVFLVAMPVVFTFVMSFAYRGSQPDPEADTRLVLAWVDQDENAALGASLAEMVANSDTVRLEFMEESQALEAVRAGDAAGTLIIPPGYSATVFQGGFISLSLVADSASINGQSLYQTLRGPVTQLMSAVEIARLNVELIQEITTLPPEDQQAEFSAAYQSAQERWMNSDSAARVQTQLAAAPAATDPYGGNPYNQSSPGILVMFAIFGLVSSAQILVQERKTRTLERMRTTSLSPAEIVGGHFLAMFLLTLLQQILLVAFGQVALGVNYLSAPWGILGVMVTLALCVASMGLLIGVIAKQEEQVILFSLVAMFVFSGLGGVWFPLEGAGQAFATIGRLTPTAWAMKGFQNILIRGLDSASVLLPSGILLAYAACFFILAVWRFRKID